MSPEAKQFVWSVIDFLIVRLPALLANGRAAREGSSCPGLLNSGGPFGVGPYPTLWILRTSVIM